MLLLAGCTPRDATVGHVPLPKTPGDLSAETSSASTIQFTDVTKNCGVSWTYQNGREAEVKSILESLGGGVAMIDFDADGRLDLFFTGGGRYEGQKILGLPSAMFRNLGDWKFSDVSATAGDGFPATHFSHGCFGADYDNDGFTDVLVTG